MTPRTTKTAPAIRRNHSGEMKRDTAPPARTASAELVHRANAEATKTVHFDAVPADIDIVASCVLSPSSAMKTAPKVDARVLQSIVIMAAGYDTTSGEAESRPLEVGRDRGGQDRGARSTSCVISAGAATRMGGPQKPVPRLT